MPAPVSPPHWSPPGPQGPLLTQHLLPGPAGFLRRLSTCKGPGASQGDSVGGVWPGPGWRAASSGGLAYPPEQPPASAPHSPRVAPPLPPGQPAGRLRGWLAAGVTPSFELAQLEGSESSGTERPEFTEHPPSWLLETRQVRGWRGAGTEVAEVLVRVPCGLAALPAQPTPASLPSAWSRLRPGPTRSLQPVPGEQQGPGRDADPGA